MNGITVESSALIISVTALDMPIAAIEVGYRAKWCDAMGRAIPGLTAPVVLVSDYYVGPAAVSSQRPLHKGEVAVSLPFGIQRPGPEAYTDGTSSDPPVPPPPPEMVACAIDLVSVTLLLDGPRQNPLKVPALSRFARVDILRNAQVAQGTSIDNSALLMPVMSRTTTVQWPAVNGRFPAQEHLSTGDGHGGLLLLNRVTGKVTAYNPSNGMATKAVATLDGVSAIDVTIADDVIWTTDLRGLMPFSISGGALVPVKIPMVDLTGVTAINGRMVGIAGGVVGDVDSKHPSFRPLFTAPELPLLGRAGRLGGFVALTDVSANRINLHNAVTGRIAGYYEMSGLVQELGGADGSASRLFVDDRLARATLVFELIGP